MCNTGSFVAKYNTFSMGFWFKQTTGGQLLQILNGAVVVFKITTSTTGFAITFGG